ncbi:MAG TPA: hypothetical protein VN684_03825 [Terriglobales bacterium]|jgi:hypothetical protein|nr:hypothetical protein [Terriglobales bacterium]
MAPRTVKDIERAIETLSPEQVTELYTWLDQHYPQPIDIRLQTDIAEGRLDSALDRALDDEKNGRVRPL